MTIRVSGSSDSSSGIPAPPSSLFPLAPSANGRFVQDTSGAQFLMKGDAAWEIFNELTAADLEYYLRIRKGQRFNTLVTQITNSVKYVASSVAPAARGAGLALPFLLNTSGGTWTGVFANQDADFASPNPPYWDWCEQVFSICAAYGFAVIVDGAYWGFNFGATDGWYQTIGNTSNTQSICFAFGAFLGNIYNRHPNVIISKGTDTFPLAGSEISARIAQMHDGIRSVGCTAPALAHYQRSSGSLDYAPLNGDINLRGTYSGVNNGATFAPNYARLRQEWNAAPTMPAFCIESNYSPARTRTQMRTLAWQGFLSSPAGYSGYGQDTVWLFDTGWQTALETDDAKDMAQLWAFADSRIGNWSRLQPRGLGSIGSIVTAGGGTLQTMGNATPTQNSNVQLDNTNGQDWVAAAANQEGTLLVAYFPVAHSGSCTFDMTILRGTITATWYDPTNGAATAIGSFPNTGTQAFTTPGNNAVGDGDWALELRAL